MARPVDLSAFEGVRSFADYDKAAMEEARQRYMQAQQMKLQQQAAQRQNDMFELEKQKFEAEKAQPNQMFGGNSFQAQLGNQMKNMGYSDEQIVQALTMKGIPLQNGGYATYSPSDLIGQPNQVQTRQQAIPPQPLGQPSNMPAPKKGEKVMPPDIDAIKQQVGEIMGGGEYSGVRTIVPSGQSAVEKEAALQSQKDARLLQNRMAAMNEAKQILASPNANPTESNLGYWRNVIQKETGLGGSKERELNARLGVLGGFLVSSVPRMEGPQSNIDVENYKIMAGKVGDPTATVEERLAALDALNELSRKYSGGENLAPSEYSEGDTEIDPETGRVKAVYTNGRWVQK